KLLFLLLCSVLLSTTPIRQLGTQVLASLNFSSHCSRIRSPELIDPSLRHLKNRCGRVGLKIIGQGSCRRSVATGVERTQAPSYKPKRALLSNPKKLPAVIEI